MKTSLGIWAMGSMVTRFVPAGYQPQHARETTAQRVARAVDGLRNLIDGYEFHYPQELSDDNLDEVRSALGGHDIYCIATGLHLDPGFGKGGLTSPDPAVRAEALKRTVDAADFAGRLGAHFIIWPGIEGYNYPFQTPYADSWRWLIDGVRAAAERCAQHGVLVFLEHKNSEPAMKILMRNIGMTLHVIHKLRAEGTDNVKVNMDWQHLLMNGEHLPEYAAMLATRGCSGTSTRTRGGALSTTTTWSARRPYGDARARAGAAPRTLGSNAERLGFDLYPYTPQPGWAEPGPTTGCGRRARRSTGSAPGSSPASGCLGRCMGSSPSTATCARCGRRSSGRTSAALPSVPRSSPRWAASG